MNNFWDDRYASDAYVYGEAPNMFFKTEIDALSPGKLLLPAEGEGRNAVYAAKKGWLVEAFDSSLVAKTKAKRLAEKNGVKIHYHTQSVPDFNVIHSPFDAIALIYTHFPETVRVPFHKRLIELLKPGGNLIIEAFHAKQIHNASGGPKIPEMLYTEDILRNDFGRLNIVSLKEFEIELDEGEFHRGRANVIRLLATK